MGAILPFGEQLPASFNSHLGIWMSVIYFRLVNLPINIDSQGECKMKMSMPKTISGWCMWLFFLWFGLGAFVALPMATVIGGILALGYAVFAFIGM